MNFTKIKGLFSDRRNRVLAQNTEMPIGHKMKKQYKI